MPKDTHTLEEVVQPESRAPDSASRRRFLGSAGLFLGRRDPPEFPSRFR